MIPYLVRGLCDPLQRSALMSRHIRTINELIAELKHLESYNFSSEVASDFNESKQRTNPQSTSLEELAKQFYNFKTYYHNQQKTSPTTPMAGPTISNPPTQTSSNGTESINALPPLNKLPLTGANLTPLGRKPKDEVECYRCNLFGHYASQCPTKQNSTSNPGNARAGPAGQSQQ